MSQISVNELKEKFTTVQSITQGLKEEKIRLESELNTLEKDYDEQVKELLEKTGASSLEEAKTMYDSMKDKLESDMVELEEELNKYLDTYGEEEESDGVQ